MKTEMVRVLKTDKDKEEEKEEEEKAETGKRAANVTDSHSGITISVSPQQPHRQRKRWAAGRPSQIK